MIAGRTPKPDDRKVNRVPLAHPFVEVPDVAYCGERPALPAWVRGVPKTRGAVGPLRRVPRETVEWWERVTTLPHCVLWRAGDWQRALDTVRLHALFIWGEEKAAAELRTRERAMGTTLDALPALRIRYVQPGVPDASEEPESRVRSFDDERRRRLMSGAD